MVKASWSSRACRSEAEIPLLRGSASLDVSGNSLNIPPKAGNSRS